MSLALIALLAGLFWTQSRYPALNDKAIMEGSIQMEDPLSFESFLSVDPSDPMWKKIVYTTINWIKTNKNGMTFGVLIGAAFLTLIRYLPQKSLKGRFTNSLAGMAIGAPLGVCVNCAAPIAKGIYTAGARAELTLSAMIASPTLNIVVLTMAFGIMPFEIAITKLILSIVVIIGVVPLVVRMGFMGKSMVIDTHIEVGYYHTGGMQISVHAFCLSSRRAVARVFADGRVEYRIDPNWLQIINAERRWNGKCPTTMKNPLKHNAYTGSAGRIKAGRYRLS